MKNSKKGFIAFLVLVMCMVMLPVGLVEAANKYVPKKRYVITGEWLVPIRGKKVSDITVQDYAGCHNSLNCLLCNTPHFEWKDPSLNVHDKPGSEHRGLDLTGGSQVVASRAGKIVYYGWTATEESVGRGIVLIIEHKIDDKTSYYSLYQHLSRSSVKGIKKGKNVNAGDLIAYMGNTGMGCKKSDTKTNKHLHFEIFYGPSGICGTGSESDIPKSFMENNTQGTGLINTNFNKFRNPGKKNSTAYESSSYHTSGAVIYLDYTDKNIDKINAMKNSAPIIKNVSESNSGSQSNKKTATFKYPTGTYQVGPKFTGMKEGRVIRKGKTEKTDIIVHLPEGAKVYVKETYKNENVAKVVYKANNTTYNGYMYIADKAGKQKFTRISASDITAKAITSAPSVTATTTTNISTGKSVSFKWGKVANATKYIVTIKKDGTEVSKKEITGTTYSYTFKNEGTYTVMVQAKNEAFWSNNSSAVNVYAYNPVTVTFKDYDGSVISKQTILYGTDAKAPSTPNGRIGYTFREWDKSYRGVKADTVITAQYDINTYKVRFFDGYGIQIGATQYVQYNKDAKAPEAKDVTVKEGYSFVQWDKQYTQVSGNIDVYALTAWENSNLPIVVVSATAEQNVDDEVVSSYTIKATLRNTNTEDTTGRAIVALTTKDGNLLTATESNAFTVKNGVDFDLQITVPYKGQATNAEIYIVNGYQYTSNSFKKDGTIPISKKYSVKCQKSVDALAFTNWTTDKPPADAVGVESKTQYASRSVSTTKQYKHTFYPNNWSAYTTSTLTASSTRKITSKKQYRYRDVGAWSSEKSTTTKPTAGTLLTITGSSTAYYYYHYMNQYTNGSYGADSVKSGSKNGYTIKKNLGKCVYKRGSKLTSKCNYGDIGGKQQWSVSTGCSKLSGVTAHSGHCGSSGWAFWYYDKEVTTYKYKTRSWGAWSAWQDTAVSSSSTRGVETRTVYAYKDAKVVYNSDPNYTLSGYTKESTVLNNSSTTYGSWSDWTDSEITGANLEVKNRTVYRWKTKEEIAVGDTIEGTTKKVSGNLSTNFAGKEAILFVYKNADASDYTTEYLGQTTIADDGSYSFEFITREEPSLMTGDFTVTLGVEGTDTVMMLDESNYENASQFKAPEEEFTVEFVDRDGKLITSQKVKRGQSAVLPEDIPSIEGYTFTGWSTNVTNIQGDYTIENDNPISAQYAVNTYEVLFVDWVEDKTESAIYEHGQALEAPEGLSVGSGVAGRTKIWSHNFDGTQIVTEDMVVTAHEEIEMFTIDYYDLQGELYVTDTVEYGESVQLMNSYDLSTEDILVHGWKLNVSEEELQCVTQNIEARPDFSYMESACVPVANVESGVYTEQQKIVLSTEDVDADIYYTLDGSDPKESGYLFNYPITIDSTCMLRTYAKLENSNDSAEAIYYYAINNETIGESDWYLLEDLPEEVISNQDRYELESKIGYRYDVTQQVMSDEEATALQNEGWQQVGEVEYTEYSEYLSELPEGIGAAEVEIVEDEDGNTLYRYRYAVWTFTNKSKWQITKPDSDEYEMDTIYRYTLPKECILTLVIPGEETKKEFVFLNEILDIDLSKYVSAGEVIIGLYKDAEFTKPWNMETDIITESTTLYLKKEYQKINIRYFDKENMLISSAEILYGENAEDIIAPEVDGYIFIGWDKSLKSITEDTDFYAQYIEKTAAKEIKLNTSKKSLFTATSYQLTAIVDGKSNYENLEWTSSNDNIATVNENGLVTGVHAGNVTITAILDSGERAVCEITVIGDEDYELLLETLSKLTVNRENNTLVLEKAIAVEELKNEFKNESVTVCNASGLVMESLDVVTTACTIEDVEDTLDIVVLGDANGDAVINEEDYDEICEMITSGQDQLDVGIARYCAADINQDQILDSMDLVEFSDMLNEEKDMAVYVTSIELAPATVTLEIGQKSTLTTTILPTNATDKTITWSSDNPKVATVDANGNVTALAAGTANVVATAADGSGVKAQCVVTVTKKQVTTSNPNPQAPPSDEPTSGGGNDVTTGGATGDETQTSPSDDTTTGDENGTTPNPAPQDPPATQDPEQPTPTPTPQDPPAEQPTTQPAPTTESPATSEETLPAVGTVETLSDGQYKVTKSSLEEKEVTFVKPKSKTKTSVTIPASVVLNGETYKVTAIADKAFKNNKKLKSVTIGKNVEKIGKEAFSNCKKLNKITIKSTVLTSVGKNAIKNIKKNATIKVPKKQLKKYKKLFKSKTGYKKTMKIKK